MKKKILSGMRPTGDLHLGHLVGALDNWVKLQEDYKCYYMVADWHAISTAYEDKINLRELTYSIVADWLAVGISPEKSVIFIQSSVKEHSELHLLLSMITPLSWVERNPSFKETIEQLSSKNISTYGFLGYPVLQAADILMYMAECVPVGIDQIPHLELSREIVRRFNNLYGETFPEPQAILTKTPKLSGLDKRKMSKSYGNFILISEPEKELKIKINNMITDPERIRKTDPGHPEICSVFEYHQCFNKPETETISADCKNAKIGCVECKRKLFEIINNLISPIRDKKNHYMEKQSELQEIIEAGDKKAREAAAATMEKVRNNMRIGLRQNK
ncbi:MAG TPA: tryptophan--tRNA ligase [bacterium]|nr:tryptophan--tRNA ligase [bacterium]HPN31566.1 tryptophan--tRNA ligase [bacterium]